MSPFMVGLILLFGHMPTCTCEGLSLLQTRAEVKQPGLVAPVTDVKLSEVAPVDEETDTDEWPVEMELDRELDVQAAQGAAYAMASPEIAVPPQAVAEVPLAAAPIMPVAAPVDPAYASAMAAMTAPLAPQPLLTLRPQPAPWGPDHSMPSPVPPAGWGPDLAATSGSSSSDLDELLAAQLSPISTPEGAALAAAMPALQAEAQALSVTPAEYAAQYAQAQAYAASQAPLGTPPLPIASAASAQAYLGAPTLPLLPVAAAFAPVLQVPMAAAAPTTDPTLWDFQSRKLSPAVRAWLEEAEQAQDLTAPPSLDNISENSVQSLSDAMNEAQSAAAAVQDVADGQVTGQVEPSDAEIPLLADVLNATANSSSIEASANSTEAKVDQTFLGAVDESTNVSTPETLVLVANQSIFLESNISVLSSEGSASEGLIDIVDIVAKANDVALPKLQEVMLQETEIVTESDAESKVARELKEKESMLHEQSQEEVLSGSAMSVFERNAALAKSSDAARMAIAGAWMQSATVSETAAVGGASNTSSNVNASVLLTAWVQDTERANISALALLGATDDSELVAPRRVTRTNATVLIEEAASSALDEHVNAPAVVNGTMVESAALRTMRIELESMKKSALRKRAQEAGVEESALEAAEDADDAKAALVELTLPLELSKLRIELDGMKTSALRKRAEAAGIDEADLDAAEDASDTKAALVALLLQGK